MPYSVDSLRKCRGKCGERKPPPEFAGNGRVCRSCREHQPPAPIPLGDGTTAVPLVGKHAHGRAMYVSDAKVPQVAGFRWRVMEYTRKDGVKVGPYAVTKRPTGHRGGETIYAHRLITGYARVDHENRYGLDNTDPNLRDATQSQNLANIGVRGSVPFKGVRRLGSGSWQARIRVNYEQRTIGSFRTPEAAARAYDAAALSAWGEFALTNERIGLLAPC
jgi:hypothetical protein